MAEVINMIDKTVVIIFLLALIIPLSAAEEEEEDPVLWVWSDGAVYHSTDTNGWLNESFVKESAPSTTYSDNVNVLAHHKLLEARDVNLRIWVTDNSTISNVVAGRAVLYKGGVPQGEQGSPQQIFTSTDFKQGKHLGVDGYYIIYNNIGNVPRVPDFSFGDPELGTWNESNVTNYVTVPVQVTFTTPPQSGYMINFEAGNISVLPKKYRSVTAYSKDCTHIIIPEFTFIALPIASILAVMFIMQRRKRKE